MYLQSIEAHLPVRGLCILNSATFMYKTLHGNTFSNMHFTRAADHQTRNLRNSSSLRFTASKTKYGDQAMEVVGPRIYNEIPINITSMRLPHSFRCALRDHLQNYAFIASCFNKDFFKFKLWLTYMSLLWWVGKSDSECVSASHFFSMGLSFFR